MRCSELNKGDILLCKGETLNEFSIFAVVIRNLEDAVTIRRYLDYGKVYCGIETFDYYTMSQYYELPSEEEKELFSPSEDTEII